MSHSPSRGYLTHSFRERHVFNEYNVVKWYPRSGKLCERGAASFAFTVIISSKVAQYLSLISDYSAYQTMPESGFAATVYLCQHELGVGQINVCREAFLKKCAGEEKCPIQPQHYYPQ